MAFYLDRIWIINPKEPLSQNQAKAGHTAPCPEVGAGVGELSRQARARPGPAWVWRQACGRLVPCVEFLNATNKGTLQLKVLQVF